MSESVVVSGLGDVVDQEAEAAWAASPFGPKAVDESSDSDGAESEAKLGATS